MTHVGRNKKIIRTIRNNCKKKVTVELTKVHLEIDLRKIRQKELIEPRLQRLQNLWLVAGSKSFGIFSKKYLSI